MCKICKYCGQPLQAQKLQNKYCSRQCSMLAVNYAAGRKVSRKPYYATHIVKTRTRSVTVCATVMVLLVLAMLVLIFCTAV